MSHCQPSIAQPATHRSRLEVLLAFLILSPFTTPLAADQILQPGPWKGEFAPANLGDDIDASFCILRDNTSTQPWKVTMRLDLPPPGNDPVEFEILEAEDESLNFRINLLGALRECLLERKHKDELTFECTLVDNDSENTDRLTMWSVTPLPGDDCQPETTVESE